MIYKFFNIHDRSLKELSNKYKKIIDQKIFDQKLTNLRRTKLLKDCLNKNCNSSCYCLYFKKEIFFFLICFTFDQKLNFFAYLKALFKIYLLTYTLKKF